MDVDVRRSRGPIDSPIAIKLDFGWALIGPRSGEASDGISCNRITVEDQDLHDQIENFFRCDFVSPSGDDASDKTHPSLDNKYVLEQLKLTITFDESIGHY